MSGADKSWKRCGLLPTKDAHERSCSQRNRTSRCWAVSPTTKRAIFPIPASFQNSRINSSPDLTLTGISSRDGRYVISNCSSTPLANSLQTRKKPSRLSLTAAVGQMSKMVFAITSRGKTNGRQSTRMEVGSWVIGYSRPEQHFEINVWNCFERRAHKLMKAVAESASAHFSAKAGDLKSVCEGKADYSLITGDTLQVLPLLPDSSVDLVITGSTTQRPHTLSGTLRSSGTLSWASAPASSPRSSFQTPRSDAKQRPNTIVQ